MHRQFLLAALEQAWLGRGNCAPNPSVGAVAVQNEKIIAYARHYGAGTAHAEKLLFSQLAGNLTDITLYVTLEPCNHWGKTPPCVDAIIKQGIKKVVYAYCDPNPVVRANNTPELLKAQNIQALHFPLPEIDAFYQSYHHWVLTGKPWVTAKIAQSFNGKIAGINRARITLSNAACSEFTHKMRLQNDVILTTACTINQDDPLLNVRLANEAIAKPIAIIDRLGTLNPHAKILHSAKHCHIYFDEAHATPKVYENCSYHPMPALHGQLDLTAVINHLGKVGYHDVWVETGAGLFKALHQARLVNKTHIYLIPKFLPENALSLSAEPDIFNRPYHVAWQPMGNNMIASFDWQEENECLPE